MKLEELKGILKISFDFADNEIDATFYVELDDIKEKYAKQINVKQINYNYVICDFIDFIQHHKTIIKKYITENYSYEYAIWLYDGLYNEKNNDNFFKYNDEAYYQFIKNDLGDILINY